MKNTEKPARLFFAIELDENTKNKIEKIIQQLQQQENSHLIKWTPINNLHLTLRFLGDTEADKIPTLIQHIENYLIDHAPFELKLNNIQFFPRNKPQVIAIMTHLSDALAKIVYYLEQGIIAFGFPVETRPFLPHITLGRLRSKMSPEQNNISLSLPKKFMVEEIILLRSDIDENGSVYTAIKKFPLKKR